MKSLGKIVGKLPVVNIYDSVLEEMGEVFAQTVANMVPHLRGTHQRLNERIKLRQRSIGNFLVNEEKFMKKIIATVLGISVLSICLTACGWKPKVTAEPLTAPWTTLNLPVKENAVVWKSEPNEFRAVHKEDKKTITKNYTDALKAQGYELGKFDESGDRWFVEMKKGAEQLKLEFYDFDNTGVVIYK